MKKLLWAKVCNQHFQVHRLQVGYPKGIFLHEHDFYEFFVIESGAVQHQINGKTVPMKKGDCWLIRPKDRHRFTFSKGQSAIITNFSFPAPYYARFMEIAPESLSFLHESSKSLTPVTLSLGNFLKLLSILLEGVTCSNSALNFYRILSTSLHLLVTEKPEKTFIPSAWPISQESRQNQLPKWLELLTKKLEQPDYFLRPVVEIQKLSGYTASRFSRMFKSYLGETPTEYLNHKRLEYAEKLLRETQRPILYIIQDCQFKNVAYFYRIFKSHFGITPGKIRRTPIKIYRGNET